jgi:hypothetical protein
MLAQALGKAVSWLLHRKLHSTKNRISDDGKKVFSNPPASTLIHTLPPIGAFFAYFMVIPVGFHGFPSIEKESREGR